MLTATSASTRCSPTSHSILAKSSTAIACRIFTWYELLLFQLFVIFSHLLLLWHYIMKRWKQQYNSTITLYTTHSNNDLSCLYSAAHKVLYNSIHHAVYSTMVRDITVQLSSAHLSWHIHVVILLWWWFEPQWEVRAALLIAASPWCIYVVNQNQAL